ncbi:MAG: ABC transporter substrate-binding protein [Phyllobacterium sp.]|uniref:ABC transporter substrate-binding protein n=1 Tax=Phyllobacterium sp. TaxID=1871046 RepID=UPI0030F1F075
MKMIIGIFIGMAALSHAAEARDLASIRKDGSIRIATEGATPPFNYFKDGKLTGFDVDLGTALAGKMGVKAEWKALSFDTLLVGLGQDRFDLVIAGHGITPERSAAVDFSTPYLCSGAVIVARAGGPTTEAELRDKTVGVQTGTTYLTAIRKVDGVGEIKTFPKDTDALQNLINKRTDAWVSDKITALDAANKNQAANLQIGDMLFVEQYGMAIAKGNGELLAAVNEAFSALLTDGTYAKISKSYFERDVRCH